MVIRLCSPLVGAVFRYEDRFYMFIAVTSVNIGNAILNAGGKESWFPL